MLLSGAPRGLTTHARGREPLASTRRGALQVTARTESPSRPAASTPAPSSRRPPPRRPAAPIPATSMLAPISCAPIETLFQTKPSLTQPWEQMNETEQRTYLHAVRDFHGRGVVLQYFDMQAGRTIQALVEPELVPLWRDYSWREDAWEGLLGTRRRAVFSPDGADGEASFVTAMEGGSSEEGEEEVVQLHVLTAERIHVGGILPDFVDVVCADGCPANCLVDNLTLKPWTADASASGEWLQFRMRLEERWAWMQMEERAEKLAAEQAQRERRQLLMQAARKRLETANPSSSSGSQGAASSLLLSGDDAVAEEAGLGPQAERPTPADAMSAEQIDELMAQFFADPKGRASQLKQATSSSSGGSEGHGWVTTTPPAADAVDSSSSSSSSGGSSAAAAGLGGLLLANPAPQLQLTACSSGMAEHAVHAVHAAAAIPLAAAAAAEAGPLFHFAVEEQEQEQEEEEEEEACSSGAPQLSHPWKDLDLDERRSYLEAVRDFHGEGVLCERLLRSGRTVLALIDPAMRLHWQAHTWRDEAASLSGRLFTETGPAAPGRTFLAQWTAEVCVLGRLQQPFNISRIEHRDGCPANCLAHNLELELRPVALPAGSSWSGEGAGAAAVATPAPPTGPPANNILPAAPAHTITTPAGGSSDQHLAARLLLPGRSTAAALLSQLGPAEAAPGAGQLRAAKMEARKSLRSVYDWLGADRGREFFAALHEEYLEAEREHQLLQERRGEMAEAGAPLQ